MIRIALAAAVLAAFAVSACSQDPSESGAPPKSAASALTLDRPAPLGKDIEALPRITTPTGGQTARINMILAAADKQMLAQVADCRRDEDGEPRANAFWQRSILTKMAGPGFLSLLDSNSTNCGGAHPNDVLSYLTQDLSTGGPIDWSAYLPKDLVSQSRTYDDVNGVPAIQFTSPALIAWYRQAALAAMDAETRKDCADAYADEDLDVVLWLDAKHAALGMETDSFPHVIQACAQPAYMTAAQLRQRGAKPVLTDALDTAHAAGVWGKISPSPAAAP